MLSSLGYGSAVTGLAESNRAEWRGVDMMDIDRESKDDSNWIMLADGGGVIAAAPPEAAELARFMAGMPVPGPQIVPETPVEMPLEEPDERPAESPEEHPDSRPQEQPEGTPDDVPRTQP